MVFRNSLVAKLSLKLADFLNKNVRKSYKRLIVPLFGDLLLSSRRKASACTLRIFHGAQRNLL